MSNNDDVTTQMYRLVSAIREGRLSNIPLHYGQSPAASAAIPSALATAPTTDDPRRTRIRELLDNNRALIERICGNKQLEEAASNSDAAPSDPRVKVLKQGGSQQANEALPIQSAQPACQMRPSTSSQMPAVEDVHTAVASTSSNPSNSRQHDTVSERYLDVEAGEGWPDCMPVWALTAANPDGPRSEEWPLRICDFDPAARTKPPLDGNPLLGSLSRRFLFYPEATSGQPQKPPRAIPLARGTLVNNEWTFPTKWDHVLAECEFWKHQHDRVKAEHRGATVELSTVQRDLEEKNETLGKLGGTFSQTRMLLDAKTLEANRLVSAMSKLRDELTVEQRLSAQRNELSAVLGRKHETLKSEIEEEQSKRKKAEEETRTLRAQLENLKLAKAQLKDEVTQTDRPAGPSPTVQKAKEQFGLLRKQNTQLRAEVDELRTKSDQLSSDNNELTKNVQELRTDIAALVQANADLEATNASAEQKSLKVVDELHKVIGAYKDQITKQCDLVHHLTVIVKNRATALRERACFQCAGKDIDASDPRTSDRYAQTSAVLAVSEPTPQKASATSPMSDIKSSMKALINMATSAATRDYFESTVPSASPSEVENPTITPSNELAQNSTKRPLESVQAIPPEPKKPCLSRKTQKDSAAATTSDGTPSSSRGSCIPPSDSANPLARMEDLVSHVLEPTATLHAPTYCSASSLGQPLGITMASPPMPRPSMPHAVSIPADMQPPHAVPCQQHTAHMVPAHAVRASMVPQHGIHVMHAPPPGYTFVVRGPAPQYHSGAATRMQIHQSQPVLHSAQDHHMRGFIATNAAKGLGYQHMRDALVKNFPGNQSILQAFEHTWQKMHAEAARQQPQ